MRVPRALSIGNGKLQVNFDLDYNLRDIFYHNVGQENHTAGDICRTGIWVDGRFYWMEHPAWKKDIRYVEDSLVTHVTAVNDEAQLTLVFHDVVDLDRDLLLREVQVTNRSDAFRDLRFFFHYDLHIYGVRVGDTVYYDPDVRTLVAFKGQRYFLMNGASGGKIGVDSWAIGVTEVGGREGTWRDAEDGKLEQGLVAQGSVDATLEFDCALPAHGTSGLYHWLAIGDSVSDVRSLDTLVRSRGPQSFISRTRNFWQVWCRKGEESAGDLPPALESFYKRSLLILRSHVDNKGAIVASTDWEVASYARDTYAYVWPRDAALAVIALDKAGYGTLTRRFFEYCIPLLTSDGYFMHKYTPAGPMASSWLPWADARGKKQLPIQEDETGLVLYALWQHYQRYKDLDFVRPYYRPLIKTAGDFLASYREPRTGLPAPSYDLWEERRGIHAWTVAAVWAGLNAAAHFSRMLSDQDLSDKYLRVAEEMRNAAVNYLFDRKRNCFVRTLKVDGDKPLEADPVMDSSILGLVLFGMFSPRDPMIVSTVERMVDRLRVRTPVGGLARYENDYFHQVSKDIANVPGNPWFVCTLWLAQYYIARAEGPADLEAARQILEWVQGCALSSGVLAEQMNPYTREPVSVSPLTWSHAEFITTVEDYVARMRLFHLKPGAPASG